MSDVSLEERNALVEKFMPRLAVIAKQQRPGSAEAQSELESIGAIGLIRAASYYGAALTQKLADVSIRNAIRDAQRKHVDPTSEDADVSAMIDARISQAPPADPDPSDDLVAFAEQALLKVSDSIHRQLLAYRSPIGGNLTWREIGAKLGMPHSTCFKEYRKARAAIAAIAAGATPERVRRSAKQQRFTVAARAAVAKRIAETPGDGRLEFYEAIHVAATGRNPRTTSIPVIDAEGPTFRRPHHYKFPGNSTPDGRLFGPDWDYLTQDVSQ